MTSGGDAGPPILESCTAGPIHCRGSWHSLAAPNRVVGTDDGWGLGAGGGTTGLGLGIRGWGWEFGAGGWEWGLGVGHSSSAPQPHAPCLDHQPKVPSPVCGPPQWRGPCSSVSDALTSFLTLVCLRAVVGRPRCHGGIGAGAARRRAADATAAVPRDNWWNLDISTAPVDPRPRATSPIIGTTRACIRTSAAMSRRAASTSTASRTSSSTAASRRRRCSSSTGTKATASTRHRQAIPFYPIPASGDHAAALGRRRRARQHRPAQPATVTCSSSTGTTRHLYELYNVYFDGARGGTRARARSSTWTRTTAGPKAGRRPTPRAWRSCPGLVRYDEVVRRRRDRPRVPRHGARHQRLRLSGIASRRRHGRRAADGRAPAPQGERATSRASRRECSKIFRAMKTLRPDRGRQRLGHVHQRHLRHALEQRRAQSRLPRAHRGDFEVIELGHNPVPIVPPGEPTNLRFVR